MENKMPITSKLLVFLHLLLGIGAIFGGGVLVIDPSGELIKMPLTLLEHSPFESYLIPGLILFIAIGVFPLLTAFALVKKPQIESANAINLFPDKHWSWAYSMYLGFALIIWITIEAFFLKEMIHIHVGYIFLGLAIQAVTLLPSVQKYYLKG